MIHVPSSNHPDVIMMSSSITENLYLLICFLLLRNNISAIYKTTKSDKGSSKSSCTSAQIEWKKKEEKEEKSTPIVQIAQSA